MNILKKIKHILYADTYVKKQRGNEEQRNQRGIALIAMMAFIVMSILNIEQHSSVMLITTSFSALTLFICYLISRYKNYSACLRINFYIIFVVIFTAYTIMGGNDGFATLWLVIATYAVMIAIDFKAGFIISLYYLIMLLLVFTGPLSYLLQYNYNETFMLRFPFLYAINFAFATYIIIRIRLYQYELLIKQEELEYLNTVDLSTGLKNRNSFIQYEQTFKYNHLETLSAIFIDINGLHEINNHYGHDAGDHMLCLIADLCKKHFSTNAIYRMGGDEFLILCENADEDTIWKSIEKLCLDVEQAKYSISYGIVKQESDFDLNELVKSADAKMIEFKKEYYELMNRQNR